MTTSKAIGPLLCSVLAACGLPGCVDTNDRLPIGDTLIVEGIAPPPVTAVDAPPATPRPDDGPSVVGLQRDHWAAQSFEVPFDGTRHHPHYRGELRFTGQIARQRNEYPTLSSALDLNGDESGSAAWWDRLAEVVVMPFFAFGEGLLIVPKLVGEPPALEEWSPSEAYERTTAWGARARDRVKPPFVTEPDGPQPPPVAPDPLELDRPEFTPGPTGE